MHKQRKKLTLQTNTIRSLGASLGGVAGADLISGTTVGTIGATCHLSLFDRCFTALSLCATRC